MHPHEIIRASHHRTTSLCQHAKDHRNRTLARAARAESQISYAGFRAKLAATLRVVAERLDPPRHGRTPEAHAPPPRSA